MGTIPVNSNLDMVSASRVVNLLDPSAAQDAATKAYVDALVEGLAWKDSARVASTANVTIASPGATIDAITMATSDRVLLKNQTLPEANGVYIWNGAATPMTRAIDMNSAAEVEAAVVVVEEGTANAGTTWRQTAVNVTLGTTALAWTAFGTAAPAASTSTAGLVQLATQGEADTGTDALKAITPATMANWSGRKLKYTTTVGDGSATSIAVTHNLGTKLVQVYIYETGGSFRQVWCEIQHTGINAITLLPTTAPASAAWTVVVMG